MDSNFSHVQGGRGALAPCQKHSCHAFKLHAWDAVCCFLCAGAYTQDASAMHQESQKAAAPRAVFGMATRDGQSKVNRVSSEMHPDLQTCVVKGVSVPC